MKRIILTLGVASAVVLGLTSCGGKGEQTAVDSDTIVSRALADSISAAQGKYIGGFVLADYQNIARHSEKPLPKEAIIKGVQTIFAGEHGDAYIMGLQLGMQMLNEARQMESAGLEIDCKVLLDNFKTAFMQDTVNQTANSIAYNDYQALIGRVEEIVQAREKARRASTPQAIQNANVGRAFLDKKKAEPDVKNLASGVLYKVESQGDNAIIEPASNIKVKYTERKADGTVVYATDSEGVTVSPNGLPKGFGEGVTMLGKGGKATIYVPAELAYGVDGLPQRGVGPNEVMVYEVEVLDVE